MATEFVGIELQLMGAEGVKRDLETIDNILNSFRGRKKFDAGLAEARRQVIEYKGELEKLKREQDKYAKGSDDWNRVADEIDDVRQKLWNAQQAAREFGLASRQAGKTFMQTFNSVSSKVAHVGSALRSFGNAMTALTSPFSRLTDGILLGAGYKALNSFTSGLESGFSRYDTMKKFPKIMTALGYGAAEADAAIKKLDASVQGLPIALDDAVSMAQRYIATTGDINKGTDIAIAANNAFLASMSTETQRYQGMMQLQDVLGGKKMNAREWYSLANSMMPAIRQMGAYLGYTGKELDDYVAKVSQGKVANEEFIKTLIAAGTDENGTIYKMAQEAKDTYEALFSRIGTAASRMVYGVIKSLDEISQTVTGMDVNQLLDSKIIPSIDKATESIKAWIQAHPEEITNFFKGLKDIKIGSFIKSYAKSLGLILKVMSKVARIGNGKGFMSALGWIMGLGRGVGKGSTILGGFLKGTRHIWAGLFVVAKWLGKSAFSKLGKAGLFGKIASIFGKKKDMETVAETAKEVPTIASTVRSAFKSLEGLMKIAGGVAIAGFTGFVAFRSVKTMVHDLKDIISELRGMDETDLKVGAGVIGGMTAFYGAMAGLGKVVGNLPTEASLKVIKGEAIIGAVTTLASLIIKLNSYLMSSTVKDFANATTYIQQGVDNLKSLPTLADAKGIASRVSDTIDGFNLVIEAIQGRYVDKGVKEGGIDNFSKGKANSLKNLASAVKNITNIATQLNALASTGLNVQGNVVSKVQAISKVANEVIKAFPTWAQGGISGPGNLNKNAKAFANALIGIRRMAYHINKLAGTSVDTGGFASFVAQLKTALASLKDVQGDLELDITVKIATGFQTSVNNVIKSINSAKKKITTAANKGIRLTIPVSVRFSLTSNVGGILGMISGLRNRIKNAGSSGGGGSSRRSGVQEAMGGYIYRARGGNVPFRRRGTDTVPAMLTPGEYVHNKRAVSAFGIDFMRKVNNLDMKGAMNELMHRAGGMANINRGTSIVNNNYNNQKVTINNNGNTGAGFTFKSASRFVGAF